LLQFLSYGCIGEFGNLTICGERNQRCKKNREYLGFEKPVNIFYNFINQKIAFAG